MPIPIQSLEDRLLISTHLQRNAPALWALYEAEALAARTIRNDVCDASKLPMIRDLLQDAIRRIAGGPKFRNLLYPDHTTEPSQ